MLISSSFQAGFIYALGYVISNNAIIVVNIKTRLKYSYENFRKLSLVPPPPLKIMSCDYWCVAQWDLS